MRKHPEPYFQSLLTHRIKSISLIGEDRTLSIKVGVEAGDPSTTDVILVRGASADVDKAVKEILKIVDAAKNDEIVNSYVSICVLFLCAQYLTIS